MAQTSMRGMYTTHKGKHDLKRYNVVTWASCLILEGGGERGNRKGKN